MRRCLIWWDIARFKSVCYLIWLVVVHDLSINNTSFEYCKYPIQVWITPDLSMDNVSFGIVLDLSRFGPGSNSDILDSSRDLPRVRYDLIQEVSAWFKKCRPDPSSFFLTIQVVPDLIQVAFYRIQVAPYMIRAVVDLIQVAPDLIQVVSALILVVSDPILVILFYTRRHSTRHRPDSASIPPWNS